SPDGSLIGLRRAKDVLIVTPEGTLISDNSDHKADVQQLAWSPDSKLLATASTDSTLRLWRRDGSSERVIEGLSGENHCLAWSRDGKQIAAGCQDGSWRAWTTDGKEVPIVRVHTDNIYGIAFSPDGKQVATCGWDAAVRIWSNDGEPLFAL